MTIKPKVTMDHPFAKSIHCTGSPFDIGLIHGSAASEEVHSNIATYTVFFQETAQISWAQARKRTVAQFLPVLQETYPEILEEMQGIAEGAGFGLTLEDILALNVRSEIALTNYTDGCTSLSQSCEDGRIFLAQNWDWLEELHRGMVLLDIKPQGSNISLKFLGEAGIVGKIGMNSAGFGLCMNAIRSGGCNKNNLPVHIMSRRLLQYATSVDEALATIEKFGLASTTNFMLADKSSKHMDIECSPHGNALIIPHKGYVAHTNHLYGPNRPPKMVDHPAANSFSRLARMQELTERDGRQGVPTSFESLRIRLSDEQGTPLSICRDRPPEAVGMERMTTLSTIMMELTSCTGKVTIGRPCDDLPIVEWSF